MAIQNLSSSNLYRDKNNARKYIESTDGIDGRILIEILKNHLRPNSTVLELGFGSGKDLDILNETYKATGSDYSQAFLDIYKQNNPKADILLIDAVTLETDRKFDCIYSNKVLHHLSAQDLQISLKRQKQILEDNGLLLHSFWRGDRQRKYDDLHFNQYAIDKLIEIIEKEYTLIESGFYTEINLEDSIYTVSKPH